MTATNHALGGAIVATAVSQPLAAVALAFMLHFFMDMLPHFGVEGKNPHDMMARSRLYKRVVQADTILVLVFLAVLPFAVNTASWILVFACMIACMAPDFVWVYRYQRERRQHVHLDKNRFSRLHSWLQFRESPKGLVFEIACLVALCGVLIL